MDGRRQQRRDRREAHDPAALAAAIGGNALVTHNADERHTTVVTVVTVKEEMANATDVAALRDGIQGGVAAALGMPLGSVRVGAPETVEVPPDFVIQQAAVEEAPTLRRRQRRRMTATRSSSL